MGQPGRGFGLAVPAAGGGNPAAAAIAAAVDGERRRGCTMSPVMTFRIAFKALGRNKMRTGLTMLGMIIGVGAVITLVAMGNGATSVIEDQIKGAGTNMITVNAGNFTQGGARGGSGSATSLTVEDAEAIRDEVPGVQYLAPGVQNRTRSSPATRTGSRASRAPTSTCRSSERGRRGAARSSARRTCRAPPRWPCSARRSTTQLFGEAPIRSDRSSASAISRSRSSASWRRRVRAWARTWTIRSSCRTPRS